MIKRKRTKGQKTIYKHTHKTKDRVTRNPLKSGMNSGAPEGNEFHALDGPIDTLHLVNSIKG